MQAVDDDAVEEEATLEMVVPGVKVDAETEEGVIEDDAEEMMLEDIVLEVNAVNEELEDVWVREMLGVVATEEDELVDEGLEGV